MYVISNQEKCKGAASILNHALLKKFAADHNCTSICVIGSSIHEAILVPLQGNYDIEDFNVSAFCCPVVTGHIFYPKIDITERSTAPGLLLVF
jgi:hypothetical protein